MVLNDHWPDMVRAGIVSNRLFDAVSAGAVVVSDNITSLEELFDGSVFSFNGFESFETAVRAATTAGGSPTAADRVRSNHSFDARAAVIAVDVVRRGTCGLGSPTWPSSTE